MKDSYDFIFNTYKENIDFIYSHVMARGISDNPKEYDDFLILIQQKEFKENIVIELYENYFTPKRHEFELQILTDIVNAISELIPLNKALEYTISGVLGNTVFEIAKTVVSYAKNKFKDRSNLKDIETDLMKIEKYFKKRKKAKIADIENHLGIEKERLIPLLKLLGFKCYRRKKNNYWEKP